MYEILGDDALKKLAAIVNHDVNPIKYLAIDPGITSGTCGYDDRMRLQFMFNVKMDDMAFFLDSFDNVKLCVYENFMLYPDKSKEQFYSKMETSQVIGQIKSWAKLKGVELVEQPARIKPTGYNWIGKKPLPKSNKMNHGWDAHVHFMYWGIRNKHIDAAEVLGVKQPNVSE